MEHSIFEVHSIVETAKQLQEAVKPKTLDLADALKLAIEIERNMILKSAFVVRDDNDYPSALEAIAIALGYKHEKGPL